ncbi:hypothetical protein [Photobacterium leiognathi]|uniref:hypothetical protein n=1 Tax=Photobacterium leiognathi TaxID=553611 RepID=UPI002981C9CC|nr:hypothetical protein [Photobacterium leiognathi]
MNGMNSNKKSELKSVSADVGLVAIEAIPYVGGIIARTIDRKQNRYELERTQQFALSISERVQGLEAKLSRYDQDLALNEFMYDLASHVKTLRGEKLIAAHAGLFVSALESGKIMDCEFAFKILTGFTEHHLAVLKFMCLTDYSNAETVNSSSSKSVEPHDIYREFPIFSFTKQQPKIEASYSLPSSEHEYDTCVIDATTIDYPSPILEKIANDLKAMGLASSPLYHSFQGDPNGTLYLCITTIGKWLVQISKVEN